MNKEDEFGFFLMKAVSCGNESNQKFYFDKKNDIMFSLEFVDSEVKAHYRNSAMPKKTESKRYFTDVLSFFEKNEFDNFVEIPKITLSEKKIFLSDYIDNLDDEDLKLVLSDENQMNPEILDFKFDLRKENFNSYARFDMARGKFICSRAMDLVEPIGITESTSLVW